MTHTIAIVDDDSQQRELALRALTRALGNADAEIQLSWQIKGYAPLQSIGDFGNWVQSEDVRALLLDERLNEQLPESVTYLGHDVVLFLAPRDYALPIYFLTAVPDDAGARSVHTRVRGVIERADLSQHPDMWLGELIRDGQRFVDRETLLHERLSEIARHAVEGSATPNDLDEAVSIRVQLGLVFEPGNASVEREVQSRSEMLTRLDNILSKLESTLADDSPAKLKPRPRGKVKKPKPKK